MAQRQESIQKKSAELFKLEEDLRLLKKDISEEISDLGGDSPMTRCEPGGDSRGAIRFKETYYLLT